MWSRLLGPTGLEPPRRQRMARRSSSLNTRAATDDDQGMATLRNTNKPNQMSATADFGEENAVDQNSSAAPPSGSEPDADDFSPNMAGAPDHDSDDHNSAGTKSAR
jgi:hypothetical protein